MIDFVRTKELYRHIPEYLKPLFCECEYPWQILPKIKDFINLTIEKGIEGYTLFSEGILVGKNVKIYSNATVEGPAIIGSKTEIRPGAFIRGSVIIGEECVIGNSTEIKNSVFFDRVQAPHYNYIGDSILGYKSHTGAGTIASNLKSDQKNVVVRGEKEYFTELRKVGAFLGDGADVGCGVIMNPGTVVGNNTRVYPGISLRGVYPQSSIVKDTHTVVRQSCDEDILP